MCQCCQLQRQLLKRWDCQRTVSSSSETTTIRLMRLGTSLQSRIQLGLPQSARPSSSPRGPVPLLSTRQVQRAPRRELRCHTETLSPMFYRRALAREETLPGMAASTERVTVFWASSPFITYMVSYDREIYKTSKCVSRCMLNILGRVATSPPRPLVYRIPGTYNGKV